MYSLRILNRVKPVQQVRLVSNFPTLRDTKPPNSTPIVEEPPQKSHSANPSVMGPRMITPRNIDKRIMVWMKYYKSVDEVPNQVTYEALDKAQNWFRIRCANWMMLGTLAAIVAAIWSGKKKAEKGISLETINMDWHQQLNQENKANSTKSTGVVKE